MKCSPADLLLIVRCFEHSMSFESVSDYTNCGRRSLYRWLDESQKCAEQGVLSPYFIPETKCHFHEAVAKARTPREPWDKPEPLPEHEMTEDEKDEAFAKQAAEDDDAKARLEDRIDKHMTKVGPGQFRQDIQDLRDRLRAGEFAPKNKPEGHVQIFGRDRADDPQERVDGAPVRKSIAQIEREHPRAYELPPLKPPTPKRPAWAKPVPLDTATIGSGYNGTPPDEGRFTHPNVPTKRYSLAERRAGTVQVTDLGIKRW